MVAVVKVVVVVVVCIVVFCWRCHRYRCVAASAAVGGGAARKQHCASPAACHVTVREVSAMTGRSAAVRQLFTDDSAVDSRVNDLLLRTGKVSPPTPPSWRTFYHWWCWHQWHLRLDGLSPACQFPLSPFPLHVTYSITSCRRASADKWRAFITWQMSLQLPNQQCQSTAGSKHHWPPTRRDHTLLALSFIHPQIGRLSE